MSLLAAMTFVAVQSCQKTPESVTEINLESETLQVAPEGGSATMGYTITNPIEGVTAEATSTTEWLHDFDCSTEGQITFIVDENPEVGQSRTATVTVTYGTIEKDFTVLQGEGVEKAPFDVTITEIGYDYAIADITPLDPEITYMTLCYEQWALDQYGSLQEVVDRVLNDYSVIAGMAGIDLKTFLEYSVLLKGPETDIRYDQLAVNVDHYIFVVGLDSDGNILTESVKEPFTTEAIDMIDVSFDMSYQLDGLDVSVKTVPSDNSVRYYTDIKPKAELTNGAEGLQGWIHTLIWRGSVNGKSPEQVIEEITTYGESNKDYYLNANTEYYAFAVAVNETGIVCSEAQLIEFTSQDVPTSDNTFTLELAYAGTRSVDIHIIPSNDDRYSWGVTPVEDWEGISDDEYIDEYIINNYLSVNLLMSSGETTQTWSGLEPDKEYYAFVFGFEQNTRTTAVSKIKVKTASETQNPDEMSFIFDVTVLGPTYFEVDIDATPDDALYYWDVIDASATQETAKATLDASIATMMEGGWYSSPAEVLMVYGARRGDLENYTVSYYYNLWLSYLEGGKEYKLYAVGIDETTGEYTTDFYFSEPFTTPEQ